MMNVAMLFLILTLETIIVVLAFDNSSRMILSSF